MNSKTVLSNFIWRLFERIGAQLVSVAVSIVLARILSPTDYGTVALMNVFINILAVFIDAGFSSALVQKKDADDTDFSTIFYFQMLVCICLYLLLFYCAPRIAAFYVRPEMTAMIRVLGITFIISGIKSTQTAYVSRNMMFKKFFFATLAGTIGAAFVGIGLAMKGFGAWALIGQSLFNNTIDTIILWVTVKWRPQKKFSLQRLKGLFSYSWKLLISALLDTGYNNLRSLLIGKFYTSEDLAYYDKGKSWPNLVISNVNTSIDSVLLPSLSASQDDPARVKAMTRRAIKTGTYVMAPLLMGLAFCGVPLVRLVLTEKWLPLVPFQRIFCITFMFYPIHTANLNAIKAMGRSDLFLKLEILKKLIGLGLLLITLKISVMAMAYSLLASTVTAMIINSWPNRELMNYSFPEQLKDILPGILLAVFMGACVYWFKYLSLPDPAILLIQTLVGAAIYIGGSALFKLEAFTYIFDMTKQFMLRRKTSEL